MQPETSEASAKAGPGVLLGGEHPSHKGLQPQRQASGLAPGRIIATHWLRDDPLELAA